MSELSAWARLLLWDYERGSVPYDLLCALMALFLWLVSGAFLHDPMGRPPTPSDRGTVGEAR